MTAYYAEYMLVYGCENILSSSACRMDALSMIIMPSSPPFSLLYATLVLPPSLKTPCLLEIIPDDKPAT